MATAVTSAFSERRRRSSSHSGKYDPVRSFGIASSIVPGRVLPAAFLIAVAGVGGQGQLLVAGPARASASALIQRLRERLQHLTQPSGLAWDKCSSKNTVRSILGTAVIVMIPLRDL